MKYSHQNHHHRTHGFTLIELMVTLLIISIFLGIGIPGGIRVDGPLSNRLDHQRCLGQSSVCSK